ncbi:CIC11C00000004316 [Sungouiella intermedia]|uniref:CIC11C00000004058 n=1 Tax=Sungouiella intermedia TaxID=45354 RepID=A0A1L0DDJ0_9ASCO|nr:CIC11C00000004058 [[Candida] intermedia]SGZ54702.1 CIC11C00000004316 [[Candida] intermedia]
MSEYEKSELEHISDQETGPSIDYNNCSWQRAAGLLFSEYICLAIMSFPWSYSVLGLIPGLILTVFVSLTVLYTGLTITEYCIAYPHITSVCDIGKHLFWNSNAVWYATAVCFLCNNTLIQALHVLVGAKYFNTISDNTDAVGGKHICSIVFAVVTTIICFLISLPRTFSSMLSIAYFSAITMFIAVVLAMAFAGVQDHPYGFDGTPVTYHLWPKEGTTYVEGMGAVLNIVYTFVGQITYPSFISQMREPRDFKKALYIVTLCEVITFALAGSVVYVYVGNQYITAPAFGSLIGNYKKVAFSFALPTILFLGSLYSNVSSQFLFLKIFSEDSKNRNSHTVLGWATWTGLNLGLWLIAFVVAEVIPFFSDLLSLMSSLFDCWFGFVFWGVAYFKLIRYYNPETSFTSYFKTASLITKLEMIANVILVIIGLYILGPGLYATIKSIVLSYESGLYGSPFTCVSNAV